MTEFGEEYSAGDLVRVITSVTVLDPSWGSGGKEWYPTLRPRPGDVCLIQDIQQKHPSPNTRRSHYSVEEDWFVVDLILPDGSRLTLRSWQCSPGRLDHLFEKV